VLTYSDKEDGKGKVKGTVLLEGCVVRDADAKTKKKHSFEVFHAQRRAYFIHAQNPEERDAWKAAIEAAIQAPVSRERNLALKEKKLRSTVANLRARLQKALELSEHRRT
jgi:septal ring factor EnvC (AmiA/AmiB activator)